MKYFKKQHEYFADGAQEEVIAPIAESVKTEKKAETIVDQSAKQELPEEQLPF